MRHLLLLLMPLWVMAFGADLIASDLPIAARVDGRLYLLPCLTRPAALRDFDQQELAQRATWLLGTPIPYGPFASQFAGLQLSLAPPSATHLLGTDDRGRDVAARLVHGARTAVAIGVAAVALYLAIGLLVGLAAAVHPRIDWLLGRLIELGLTFPTFFLLLAIQGAWGSSSLIEVAIAVALVRWPEVARLVRASARQAAQSPHVEAARALGVGPARLAWHHILPAAASPAITAAAFGIGQAVLIETGLTYLGFGVPPPVASWGELLSQAQGAGLAWWLVVPPMVAIAGTVWLCQRAAEAIRHTSRPSSLEACATRIPEGLT